MSINLQSPQNDIDTVVHTAFIVDCFEEGADMVYHFYPNPIEEPFKTGFHLELEKAFQSVLPDSADVRAKFIEQYEMEKFERTLRPEDMPHSSFWVRVKELASNPMSGSFLKSKVFNKLDELTR